MSEEPARTPGEIVARIEALKDEDFFGFKRGDLIEVLPFSLARPWLKDDASEESWNPASPAREAVIDRMREYMSFAWDKANNCRGISAYRSLCHMTSWLWLAGEDELLRRVNLEEHTHYGKPQLRAICDHFGWDWRAWDDGEWRTEEGEPGVEPEQVPEVLANA